MTETSPADHDNVSDNVSPIFLSRAIPLAERALIAVAGPDAEHFLHNLLTADIVGLKPGMGTLAALLTPQGKMIADMLVFDASDEEPLYLIDLAFGFAEDVARKLMQYRLRARVSIDLLPEPTAVFVCLDCPKIEGEEFYSFADPRDATLGQRLHGPREALMAATRGFEQAGAEAYHARRVALGIPEAGKDFVALDTFPHEANLDQLGGVDFNKGCYIGQEVVSRMQHRAMARTRTVSVRYLNGFGVLAGAEIRAGETRIGAVGESFGDRTVGLVRLDRLEEALRAGKTITSGGVPVAISKPHYASFTMPSA